MDLPGVEQLRGLLAVAFEDRGQVGHLEEIEIDEAASTLRGAEGVIAILTPKQEQEYRGARKSFFIPGISWVGYRQRKQKFLAVPGISACGEKDTMSVCKFRAGQEILRLRSGQARRTPGASRLTPAQRRHFSRATTKSGTQSRARLISESGKLPRARRASSANCEARARAASSEP